MDQRPQRTRTLCTGLDSDRTLGGNSDQKYHQTRAQRSDMQAEVAGPVASSGPGPSSVSPETDHLMGNYNDFSEGADSSGLRLRHEEREESGLYYVSLKSDRSMGVGVNFKAGLVSSQEKLDHQSSGVLGGQQQHSNQDSTQQDEEFHMRTHKRDPEPQATEEEEDQRRSSREESLRKKGEEDLTESLFSGRCATTCGPRLKKSLQRKFHSVSEGIAQAGNSFSLNQIYTELYITEGGTDQVNQEHEVRQIETAGRKAFTPETTIRQEDLFRSSSDRDRPTCLLTKGVAGIGKTLLTQKLTLDWAEDKAHQNFHFMFPFTFRELNTLKEKTLSLEELVHLFFPETKEFRLSSFEGVQVLFIFDGLDECRLPLDFINNRVLTEARESTSVDVLLTNLIRGNLLPSAHLWVTTRPAAANQIPPECVDMVTEVRGFTDLQKEEYFKKRFGSKSKTNTILSHIKGSRSLYIMCHIPIFCWITATVLEDMLKSRETRELPKSLTEMYIHFLVVQIKVKKVKFDGGSERDQHWTPESRKMIESLGKLAFEQLETGNLIFYESDLTECGIDITAASVYSGVFTQIFRETETGLYQDKVFCFIHLSLQEFLAALHVHLTFTNSGVNLLEPERKNYKRQQANAKQQFYQKAVEQTLESQNGHLDLFLRFLLGLSLKTNQTLLRGLLPQSGNDLWINMSTVDFIKKKINQVVSPERTINLFYCLNELNQPPSSSVTHLDLSDNDLQDSGVKLLCAGLESPHCHLETLSLSRCMISEEGCASLASALSSNPFHLRELDLSYNHPGGPGLELLSAGLESPDWRLETLRLKCCGLTERSCPPLYSVLSSPSSSLTQLDLSDNDLQDSLKVLCAGLKSPHCHLETLRLRHCELTERSCPPLSSVLSSPSSSLTQLDLSDNDLKDSGVKLLCAGLESPHCHLETLSLSGCMISEEGCASLASALSSNPSHLRELDLSYNHPGGPGLEQLSAGLERPDWRLESLRLRSCGLSEESCLQLSPVLSSPSSSLTQLDLSDNNLQDSGVKLLCAGLESPHCHLETLRLRLCRLTEGSCPPLSSVLSSPSSSLTQLDLSDNDLQDSGVKLLCAGLESPHCHLETLSLSGCMISEEGCASLASALSSNPSHLRELDLSYNHPGGPGLEQLSAGLESPDWKLQTLRLDHGGEQRLRPGLLKYFCPLTLDPNTAHQRIRLSNNYRRAELMEEDQNYPEHPERFLGLVLLMCRNQLTGCCYWEVDWTPDVHISVTYRGKRTEDESHFGNNDQSWSLICADEGYFVCHNKKATEILTRPDSYRVGVFVDCPAGSVSFYKISSDALIHLHTFFTSFTQPLYPGFGLRWPDSSVTLHDLT
ncbi:LOW QUALITY PROTEIN: NACHT, LRR and PYD domains-containing protein 12-like [Synchiropus splendidus]|uniref:LOW QUALITY PROTEIN: NACHT, LRR and PYD domains-containing protein 12-like n=1 Tax=Synchiropus splendidus TaxID=270530 RepID=UPI00237E966C|nr:LOW QUALITY PROTEIN: NACHT, LRR and PYD domains-containing protein 12-like [Synchiropus splendidus]